MRSLSRHIINFLHNLVIPIGVLWYFDMSISPQMLGPTLLGLVGVLCNLYWIIYVLGLLGARFRDIEWGVQAFVPLLFFISPVIFRPDRLPEGLNIIWWNPLSYFIEAMCAPVLGSMFPTYTYVVLGTLCVTGFVLILCLRGAQRLVFWM